LDDVFGYGEPDFSVDHASPLVVEFRLAFHDPDFVAEKSRFAREGMCQERLFRCESKVQFCSQERCEPLLDFFGFRLGA
jgi:hypothetical protein